MRLIKAFFYSMNGLRSAFKSEAAFRLEAYLLILAAPIVVFTPLNSIERVLLIISYAIVMITELLNTGLEKAIDRISLEHHELSKIVKDIASAAVFIALLMFVLVWSIILFPKFL